VDAMPKRLEMLELEGLGFSQSEIAKESALIVFYGFYEDKVAKSPAQPPFFLFSA
jgi:hypothetical protein